MQFMLLFYLFLSVVYVADASLIVSTYNLWNVMFNWTVRKNRIADMIKETRPNVIALQEVRCQDNYLEKNQVLELKQLLPSEYKWHVFRKSSDVTAVTDSIHTQWTGEGLGLISNLPITESSFQLLIPTDSDPDKNSRIVLHAAVQTQESSIINIVVVHMSYQRQQQCKNAAEILGFIASKQLSNVLILGDFNAYNEFDWPVMMLSHPYSVNHSPCKSALSAIFRHGVALSSLETLYDAWLVSQDNDDGYTFSNMPTPGFESRPDRILINTGFEVSKVSLSGNGTRYRRRYTASVHWERFVTILQSAYLSYYGKTGYPCLHDCGPRGSCQCGVCVKGDNRQCNLPHCSACDSAVFRSCIYITFLGILISAYLCFVAVLILVIGAGSYGDTMFSILGCNCCLCNPKLLMRRRLIHSHSRCKLIQILNMGPFRLPPYVQLVIGSTAFLAILYYSSAVMSPVLQLTYAAMEEEFYPSDHLMLTAYIDIKQ